jgi:L-lactate dehydrogenase (cytochrome)
MDDRTKARPGGVALRGLPDATPRQIALRRRYPTVDYVRQGARRHGPRFAFEYCDGGAGSDGGIKRNAAALDAIELIPRYGLASELPAVNCELFGRSYSAPLGIAPIGTPSIVLPGADEHFATAAQRARVPYIQSTVAGMSIERAAELAPDVFWFQLYRFPRDDHAIGHDLVRRADAAGAHVLVITLDTPVRTVRSREVAVGITHPFKPDLRMILDILSSPRYCAELLTRGHARFANLMRYAGERAGINEAADFVQRELRGAFTWDEVARYRDAWKGPLVLKGILHPADAERAVSLGVDGIYVSNHGGRQIEALPAPIDALPAVVAAVGHRATVLIDGGIRHGLDVVRALALGASAAFAGKAFLWSLGAIGAEGPGHVIDLLTGEARASLAQVGARSLAEARHIAVRHPGALKFGNEP